jgi:hypothetical protein
MQPYYEHSGNSKTNDPGLPPGFEDIDIEESVKWCVKFVDWSKAQARIRPFPNCEKESNQLYFFQRFYREYLCVPLGVKTN